MKANIFKIFGTIPLCGAFLVVYGADPAGASIDLEDTGSGSAVPATASEPTVGLAATGVANTVTIGAGEIIISPAIPVKNGNNSGVGTNASQDKLAVRRIGGDSALILSEEQSRNLASLEGLNKNVDMASELVQVSPSDPSKVASVLPANDRLLSGSGTALKPPMLLTAPASSDGILYNDSPVLPEAHAVSDQDNQ